MGLSSALDWWDKWKLRILVLCSLFVQFFLFFAADVRWWYTLRRLRVIVWLAYIGGDALAVYALATLFNRQKQQITTAGGDYAALEVVWAPVLLIHLGGQPFITAYSLEDNELWKRHAITLVSQVTVALYVFCKWWSGEKRLLQATVLLFIVGILKFAQKPWALRRASYGSITSTTYSSSSPPRRGVMGEGINYSLEEYVKEAQKHIKEGRQISDEAQIERFKKDEAFLLKDIYKMFLDLAAPYSVRLHFLQSFLNLDGGNQHKVLRQCIAAQFASIYTKDRSLDTCLGACSFLVLPFLALASVVLFAKSDKDGYDNKDITVTYILFFGTFVMEWAPYLINGLLPHALRKLVEIQAWQDMVSQHNIMSFCARDKKPPTLMKLVTFSYLRDYINKHWYIRYEPAAQQISMLVRHHAEEDGWKEYIRDAATYRRFNNLRGEHTLNKMSKHLATDLLEQDKLGWTFNRPFDEYVLLWHLATDLCLHHTSTTSTDNTTTASSSQSQDTIVESRRRRRSSEIISNYMIYLLFICPDMLIPAGTRSDLFMLACDEIESMTTKGESPSPLPDDETRSGIAQWILGMEQGDRRMVEAPRISEALRLARFLIDSLNEEQRWEVIQGVWVEMLCYSASRCRAYLHVKSLGVAGEFLTNVWLLWWCMGMQTLPDMMHNPEPPEEITAAASV